MRRNLLAGLVLCIALTVGVAAIANAAKITIRAGNLIVTLGGSASPKKLPRKTLAPVSTHVFGKIRTDDGTHPSALRELVIDFDKDAAIDVKGLPVCKPAQLEARSSKAARKVCGKAIVGKGNARAEIAFAEQPPIQVKSPLTAFNGGKQGGKTTLLIHAFITVPVPASIVTKVTIAKRGPGLHTVARIPRIVGGNGSAISFDFNLKKNFAYKGKKRSYLLAKCPDGKFKVSSPRILFKNESKVPEVAPKTEMSGVLFVPCTPKG